VLWGWLGEVRLAINTPLIMRRGFSWDRWSEGNMLRGFGWVWLG